MTRRITLLVSPTITAPPPTGAHRYALEVVRAIVRHDHEAMVRVVSPVDQDEFTVIDRRAFGLTFRRRASRSPRTATLKTNDLDSGDIVYDLRVDALAKPDRSSLYATLKAAGAVVVAGIHDLAPADQPMLVDEQDLPTWIDLISAIFDSADLVITPTRVAEQALSALAAELGVPRSVPVLVTGVGGDPSRRGPLTLSERKTLARHRGSRFILMFDSGDGGRSRNLALRAFDGLAKLDPTAHLVILGTESGNEAPPDLADHLQHGDRLHWVCEPSDSLVGELLSHAHVALYLTDAEGRGIPIVEALAAGTPVVATRTRTAYEWGRDLADYSYFASVDETTDILSKYFLDVRFRSARAEAIAEAPPARSWSIVGRTILRALTGIDRSLDVRAAPVPTSLQFVVISNDPVNTARCLAAHDRLSPAARSYVVICPSSQVAAMSAIAVSRPLEVIAEEDALGQKFAEFSMSDHQRKNWMLRATLVELAQVDDEFVMLDDDDLPLVPITIEAFVDRDGRRYGYFSHDLVRWAHRSTSFDLGQHATRRLLDEGGFEVGGYSAHQPQVISKSLLAEAVAVAEEHAPDAPIDEWSVYFNVAATRYPLLVHKRRYETLFWPSHPMDWRRPYPPAVYSFENHYPSLYVDGHLSSLSTTADTVDKVSFAEAIWSPWERSEELYARAERGLGAQNLAWGLVDLSWSGTPRVLVGGLPKLVTLAPHSGVHLQVGFHLQGGFDRSVKVELTCEIENGPITAVTLTPDHLTDRNHSSGLASLVVLSGAAGTVRARFSVLIDGAEEPDRPTFETTIVIVDEGSVG